MTAERTPLLDEEEVKLVVALTLPVIGRSDEHDLDTPPGYSSAELATFAQVLNPEPSPDPSPRTGALRHR